MHGYVFSIPAYSNSDGKASPAYNRAMHQHTPSEWDGERMNRRCKKALAAIFLGAGVLMTCILPDGLLIVLLAAALVVVGIFCSKC